MWNEITRLIEIFSRDPYNPELNFAIASEYENIGQTATALSFYLRCAEFGHSTHPEHTYTSLLKIGLCLESQGNRMWNVENSFLQAVQFIPDRPEAYLLLSKFYESQQRWRESYTYAELGLHFALGLHGKLPADVGYKGNSTLYFQKGVAGWWLGRAEESKEIMLALGSVRNMDEPYRMAIVQNYKNLGISMDKIAIILPVRDAGTGRSQRLLRCLNSWAKTTEGLSDVHVILDEDDVQNFAYLFERKERIEIHIRPTGLSLMEKINSVAVDVAYMYKYMCFIGDDIEFKTPWESKFIEYLSSVPAGLCYAETLDLPEDVDWATHPCITTNMVKALGFYGCPAVEHNFFDNFWTKVAKEIGHFKKFDDVIMDHRRIGWKPDFIYDRIVQQQVTDKDKYEAYIEQNFESDMQKIREAIDGL